MPLQANRITCLHGGPEIPLYCSSCRSPFFLLALHFVQQKSSIYNKNSQANVQNITLQEKAANTEIFLTSSQLPGMASEVLKRPPLTLDVSG